MKILKTSSAVRNAITDLMKPTKRRRVAVVAFIGAGAQAFVPQPKGVEIICWPRPGGTNPLELRRLIKMGARIRFADNLHMKVFWAAERGVVITSANLSTNALGAGNLKEIGVLLPPDSVNIDDVIASTNSYPCTAVKIRQLEIEHRRINAGSKYPPGPKDKVDYLEWLSLPMRSESEWKLGWWDHIGESAAKAKEIARAYHNKAEPHDFIGCREKDYRKDDWILTFRLSKKGAFEPRWLFVDYIVRVNPKEKAVFDPHYPYQAIQVFSAKHYSSPPFSVSKNVFHNALRQTSLKLSVERIEKMQSVIPSAAFLKMLAAGCVQNG